ncbi:integrase arm-type DNA-binding domain-containing protein, partial [Pseudomonas aeruginosa]|nr:integrase arm-type DNA-binding domain-containing protein [Pseudomonas aeruginosa]
MARGINKLSALAVQKTKEPGYYGDGGGLWLQISKLGGKSWVFRYTRHGKTREMGLGPIHTVSLSDARLKALEHRKSLLEGGDPLEEKKAKQQLVKLEAARHKTFKECAQAYIKANRAGWKNPKHVQQWENTLETYAFPIIGELAVSSVDTDLVLKVLQQEVAVGTETVQLWYAKAETASRLRGRLENIFDWSTFRGYRKGENPARWKGHLELRIPRHLDTQPALIWTLVPRALGHLIHVHLDRQSERSDAGLH